MKNLYTGRAEEAQEAIDRLRAEMELVTNNSSSRLRWTQHFKAFSAMTTLDRRAVIAMVQSIRVRGKNDLVITFRYLIEYVKVLKRWTGWGNFPPDLREILDTLLRRWKRRRIMARKSRKDRCNPRREAEEAAMKIWRAALYIRCRGVNGKKGDSLETQRQNHGGYIALCPDIGDYGGLHDNGTRAGPLSGKPFSGCLADMRTAKLTVLW